MHITLKNLNFDDITLLNKILEWRNDNETRLNSNNTNIITNELFLNIIQKYKDSNIKPLIIYLDDTEVGLITFINNDNRIILGININPNYRNMRIGTLALEEFIKNKNMYIGDNDIYAIVKKTNNPSLYLFKKYFKINYEDDLLIEFYL
jgi:hypothetical protein